MAYTRYHAQQGHHHGWETTLVDMNGSSLYETDDMALLTTIIERNDVAMLKQYIQNKIDPAVGLHSYSPDCIDPFFTATKHGCIDALRVLLNHYHANINEAEPLEQRDIFLLNLACRYGQLETARFLLDNDPPLGTVQDKAPGGETLLLAAAESFVYLSDELEHYHGNDTHAWIVMELARREDLIHMLVDRGASVRDHRDDPPRPRCSVLGLAAFRASYALVKRLVDDGADLHAKQEYFEQISPSGGIVRDATALHFGSMYWNVDGIRALLDHRGCDVDVADMVMVRNHIGCLPIHWAASGHGFDEVMLPEEIITPRMIDTLKLLLDSKADTINMRDNEGKTALFYAIAAHASCGCDHLNLIATFLCENGADSSICDSKGQSVLHALGYQSTQGDIIDTRLIDLLVSHGAKVQQTDENGVTALHVMAVNLRQIRAARYLLGLGADATATDSKGNTPLHLVAMRAILSARASSGGTSNGPTVHDRIRVQGEIMGVLLEAGGSEIMDQPTSAGETPRELVEKRRAKWLEDEARRMRFSGGRK